MKGAIPGVSNQVQTDSQQFQMAQQWTCLYSPRFPLILQWEEQTPKPLNLILNNLNVWKGVFHMFSFGGQLIFHNSRWHSNKCAPILIWVPTDSELVENSFHAFESDSQYIEAVERGILGVLILVPTGF